MYVICCPIPCVRKESFWLATHAHLLLVGPHVQLPRSKDWATSVQKVIVLTKRPMYTLSWHWICEKDQIKCVLVHNFVFFDKITTPEDCGTKPIGNRYSRNVKRYETRPGCWPCICRKTRVDLPVHKAVLQYVWDKSDLFCTDVISQGDIDIGSIELWLANVTSSGSICSPIHLYHWNWLPRVCWSNCLWAEEVLLFAFWSSVSFQVYTKFHCAPHPALESRRSQNAQPHETQDHFYQIHISGNRNLFQNVKDKNTAEKTALNSVSVPRRSDAES